MLQALNYACACKQAARRLAGAPSVPMYTTCCALPALTFVYHHWSCSLPSRTRLFTPSRRKRTPPLASATLASLFATLSLPCLAFCTTCLSAHYNTLWFKKIDGTRSPVSYHLWRGENPRAAFHPLHTASRTLPQASCLARRSLRGTTTATPASPVSGQILNDFTAAAIFLHYLLGGDLPA